MTYGLGARSVHPLNDIARALAIGDHVPDREQLRRPWDVAIEPKGWLRLRHIAAAAD
jgi:hypothetical protein